MKAFFSFYQGFLMHCPTLFYTYLCETRIFSYLTHFYYTVFYYKLHSTMRGSYNSIIIFVSNACLAQWGLLSDSPGSWKCLLESSALHSELSVTEPAPRKAQSHWGKEEDPWVIILHWNSSSRLNIYWQTVFPVLKSPTFKVRVWARLYASKS